VQSYEYFQLGGVPGQMYVATIHVDAIAEAKYYMSGTCDGSDTPATCQDGRAAGVGAPPAAATNTFTSCTSPDPENCNDTFYIGGEPVNEGAYNVYKITVYNPPAPGAVAGEGGAGAELQHYYLNSFPKTATPYETDTTYFISYSHEIPVPGGGVIEYHAADSNCRSVDNCGPGFQSQTCPPNGPGARQIPGVTIPQTYDGNPVSQINLRTGANQPYHSQVWHITVTNVRPM